MSTRPLQLLPQPRTALLAAAILALAGAGCSIKVRSAELSEDASYFWLGSTSSEPKTIYDTTDEQVTLHVRFHPNFVGQYRTFTVEWRGGLPGGPGGHEVREQRGADRDAPHRRQRARADARALAGAAAPRLRGAPHAQLHDRPAARSTSSVISAGAPRRSGGPQKPVPRLT